jgi:gamma-glutamyl-gamma-aminobutyrate hydrolase PuuD
MKIGLSLETTLKLRNTWHSAINHEWYDFLKEHQIVPLICYDQYNVKDYDLIILCGGNDMHDITTWRDNNYPPRDEFEKKLILDAVDSNVPLVGICRGSHFINYVLGGTHKLMETPYDNVAVHLDPFDVTCHHSIMIDKLAPGFDVLLNDNNGVIELAIHKEKRVLGIGWHPERSINNHTRSYILEIIKGL